MGYKTRLTRLGAEAIANAASWFPVNPTPPVGEAYRFGTILRIAGAGMGLVDDRRWLVLTVARTDRATPWTLLSIGPDAMHVISHWPHLNGFELVER